MKTKVLSIISMLLLGFSVISAQQTPPEKPKTITKGVLNGTAVSLSKPSYPAAAKAVRASGAVNVQVTIDEEGTVISANAVSGHPLLRSVCEQAALSSKFSPTTLQGQPVKVTGIIVYNFVMPITFLQIGYDLSTAEKSPLLPENFSMTNISGNIPKAWEDVRTELDNLSAYIEAKQNEKLAAQDKQQEKTVSDPGDTAKVVLPKEYKGPVRPSAKIIVGTADASPLRRHIFVPIETPVEILKEIQSKIENRLRLNEQTLWNFKLGTVLGRINAEIEDTDKRLVNIDALNRHLLDAPSTTSESVLSKVKQIIEFSQEPDLDSEKKQRLIILVKSLKDSNTGQ